MKLFTTGFEILQSVGNVSWKRFKKKKKTLSNEVKEAPCTDQQFNFICQENIGANTENTST